MDRARISGGFLWLVAFVFIELNVLEWRQDSLEQQAAEPTPSSP